MNTPARGLGFHLKKLALVLLVLVLAFYALIQAEQVLAPLAVAFLLALLLLPLARQMEKLGLPRGLAAFVSIVAVLAGLVTVVTYLSVQINSIAGDLPSIRERVGSALGAAADWVEARFGVSRARQEAYLGRFLENASRSGSQFFSSLVTATTGVFTFLIIMPIALYFFLSYRGFFRRFLIKVFGEGRRAALEKVIDDVQQVGLRYILGLFLLILILAVLNTLGLLLFGIGYPLFWGIFSALFAIIPYFGAFIGAALPVLFALLTTEPLWVPIGLAIWFFMVQQVEGDLIMPNVVGSQVDLNPFAAVIALVVGGEVWGVEGLVLAIPYLAILKVFCDAVEPLQPYGYLLGHPRAGRRPGPAKRLVLRVWKRVRGKRR